MELQFHSPYAFLLCKWAALLLPYIITAVFTDCKVLRPLFHYLPSSYFCAFLYLFHCPAPFCVIYYSHIVFFCSLFFCIPSILLPSLNDFVFLWTFVSFFVASILTRVQSGTGHPKPCTMFHRYCKAAVDLFGSKTIHSFHLCVKQERLVHKGCRATSLPETWRKIIYINLKFFSEGHRSIYSLREY